MIDFLMSMIVCLFLGLVVIVAFSTLRFLLREHFGNLTAILILGIIIYFFITSQQTI